MAGQLSFTPQLYQEAAIKYRPQLLKVMLFGCMDYLKHMSGRPGIRYKETVGTIDYDAQFGPYKSNRMASGDLKLSHRTLEVFFGNAVTNFEPNTAIQTLLGKGATLGDGQMKTPTAQEVLAFMAKKLGSHLGEVIWSAKRVDNGDTTAELFNGFDTITADEIKAGNIAQSLGNFLELKETITSENACDIAKEILFRLDPFLRKQKLKMYVPQAFVDMYNESYQFTHGGIPYNSKYGQNTIEGSEGRLEMVPMANKEGSMFIHIAPADNMLYGYDSMSDVEKIQVDRFSPFELTFSATLFFGVQFESLSSQRLMVVKLKEPITTTKTANDFFVAPTVPAAPSQQGEAS